MKIAAFDIDHTLVKINTHYEFTSAFLRQRSRLRLMMFVLISWLPLRKAMSYLYKDDIRRLISVKLFRKYDRQELEREARTWVDKNYEHWKNDNVSSLLHDAHQKGYRVILSSATLDFIAKALGDYLGVEYVASIYERGRIALDITGRKDVMIRRKFPESRICLFVSDNTEDAKIDADTYYHVIDDVLYKRQNKPDLCL